MKLMIKEEYFHHQSRRIVEEARYIKNIIESKLLNQEYSFDLIKRKSRNVVYDGIKADDLNNALKCRLDSLSVKRRFIKKMESFFITKRR